MAADDTVRIIAGGDVYLEAGRSPAPFAGLDACLADADLFFFNLEAPLTTHADPAPERIYAMKMEPQVLPQITNSGVDIVSLAHNHALDYGQQGLRDTIDSLRQSNIAFVGAGLTAAEAYGPRIQEVQGTRIGFLALTTNFPFDWYKATPQQAGIAGLSVQTRYTADPHMAAEHPGWPPTIETTPQAQELAGLCAEVRALKQATDVVLVSCHWGVPGSPHVQPYQTAIGRSVIEAGADVVIGHHPHVIQGIERYQDGLICYSLANLVFHTASFLIEEARQKGFDLSAIMGVDSLLLEISVTDKRVDTGCLVPLGCDADENPQLAVGRQADTILTNVLELSKPFGEGDYDVTDNRLWVRLGPPA